MKINCYKHIVSLLKIMSILTIAMMICLYWFWSKTEERNTFISEIYLTMDMSSKLSGLHEQLTTTPPLQNDTDIQNIHSYHLKVQKQLLASSQIQSEILIFDIVGDLSLTTTATLRHDNQSLIEAVLDYRKYNVTAVRSIAASLSQFLLAMLPLTIVTLLVFIYLIYFVLINVLKPLQQAVIVLSETEPCTSSSQLKLVPTRSLELATLFQAVDKSYHDQEKVRVLSEQVIKEKISYINTLSHELRTPLNAILENAKLLQSPSSPLELNDLYLGSLHLKEIINNILNKTRMDSSIQIIKLSELDLAQVFDKVTVSIKHLQHYYHSYGVVEVANNVPMKFTSDSFVIQQILVNLISNTIRHSQSSVYKVKVRYLKNSMLQLSIIDKGIGIEKEFLNQILKVYAQQNRSLESSGLGMSIASELISKLNGNIKVYSKLGLGSVFVVQLPILPSQNTIQYQSYLKEMKELNLVVHQCLAPYMAKSIKQWSNENVLYSDSLPTSLYVPFRIASHEVNKTSDELTGLVQLRKLKILVAEDYDLNIRLLSRFSRKHQLSMEFVTNGRDAIDKARTTHYDLILMDYKMPILDGLEAAKELRSWFPKEALPILMLTANTDEAFEKSENNQYINGILQKPITLTALIREISDLTFDR